MSLKIKGLSKAYGNLQVFKNLDIDFPLQRVSCILGPSGCGKTTLLNILCSLLPYDEGEIEGIAQSEISYLFQEPRLLEWKTVWGNMEFVLKKIYPQQERSGVIKQYLDMVDLTDFKDFYPNELSGGMKQRVAIARAFAYPSRLLLMDEPFKGLDVRTKRSLMEAFIRLWEQDLRTVVYVTHDVEEALIIGDQIIIFGGNPAQVLRRFDLDMPKGEKRLEQVQIKLIRQEILEEFEEG